MVKRLLMRELNRYKIGTWADIIYRNALLHPDTEAFVCDDERITFSDYNSRINRLINALFKLGVKKGNVIGILSWNCLEYVDIYGAAYKGGFIASPYNPRLKEKELEYIINYSEAAILFVGQEFAEIVNSLKNRLNSVRHYIILDNSSTGMLNYGNLLAGPGEEPDVRVDEDDPACIIYTSGTTGIPRGALYTQRCFIEDSRTFVLESGIKLGDRHILLAPSFHVGGNSQIRSYMYIAGCNIILKSANPAATLQAIQKEKATHIELVPTNLIAMINLPDFNKYDISSLKYIGYGASPMPLEVIKKGEELFGQVFMQVYGQSESGPAITYLSQDDHKIKDVPEKNNKKLNSSGRPHIGVHVRIVDGNDNDVEPGERGEIIVKSKHVMVEYWHKPEETATAIIDGWLHTGDIGYYDEEGYIYIVDRKKDMIISGGENVFPREVEEVLYSHPAVLEAAVIGIPDPYWVEKVHALVVLKQGASATVEDIIAFCKKTLAGFKVPKSIDFVDSLPKNPAGKILKKELRKQWNTN